jgi:hypothetical protein
MNWILKGLSGARAHEFRRAPQKRSGAGRSEKMDIAVQCGQPRMNVSSSVGPNEAHVASSRLARFYRMAHIWQLDKVWATELPPKCGYRRGRRGTGFFPEKRLWRTAAQSRARPSAVRGRRVAMRYLIAELISLNTVLI